MPKVKFKENHALRSKGTVEWISSLDTAAKWEDQGKVEILDKREDPPKGQRLGIVEPDVHKQIKKPPAAKIGPGMTRATGPGSRAQGRGRGRR